MGKRLIAALEAGGTKMVAALAWDSGEIITKERIPTTTPEETLARVAEFFTQSSRALGRPAFLSIGTFGPADLDPASATYGMITATPKPGWSRVDLVKPLQAVLGDLPVSFETDVNAAAMGEARWGAAQDVTDFAYITVGTGIGAGIVLQGALLRGLGHPEIGHMRIARHPDDDFAGACPFHRDCLEGLASGVALSQRWGEPASGLAASHQAWEFQAHYLAQACQNLLSLTPMSKIVFGGGVMQQVRLIELVREKLEKLAGGYFRLPLIVPAALGQDAGMMGCIALVAPKGSASPVENRASKSGRLFPEEDDQSLPEEVN